MPRMTPRLRRRLLDAAIATLAAAAVVGVYLWRNTHAPAVVARPMASDAVLDRRLPDLMPGRTTLGESIGAIRDAGVPVRLLAGDGGWGKIDASAPLDLALRRPTVRQALADIARQLASYRIATWVAADGTVKLSSRTMMNPPLAYRVYDARGLSVDAAALAARFTPAAADARTYWGGGVYDSGDAEAAARSLAYLVRRVVEPGTWDYIGSGVPPAYGGTGVEYGRLTVTQTPQAQRKVEMLLAALRAVGPAEGVGR